MTDILPIIPYPQQVVFLDGQFMWTSDVQFHSSLAINEIRLFLEKLPDTIQPNQYPPAGVSCLQIMLDHQIKSESYELKILSDQTIHITAGDLKGVFYAFQSLLQLILGNYQPGMESVLIPCIHISDEPRFSWRGFMLDESRHFQGMQTVKDLLDWMSYFKLNVFHWHLTEDQGWRIEIKKYPRLVEIGASRSASQTSGFLGKQLNNTPHSGFYTQAEIKEIVSYAAARHIQIVPEIEMPGHSMAALAAYPQLGCTGGPYQVSPHWGIHAEIMCPGKSWTTSFLQDVLTEIVALFPGQYIHTGGDEAPKKRWKKCPDCQGLAREAGVKRINDLQTILTNRIAQFLRENGHTLIGWNEMLAADLDSNAVVQYWVGREKTVLSHIRAGRKAILSNFSAYYLDHSYAHSSLDKVYRYEPVFKELEPEFQSNILGIEAPLWTEFVPTRVRLEWQVFPRLLAIAETAWLQPEKKDLKQFHQRLPALLNQLELHNIGYAQYAKVNPPFSQQVFGALTLLQAGKGERS